MIPIIYWSQTGNTEAMAKAISENLTDSTLFQVSDISVEKALEYDKIILGCPAMGSEELDDTEFGPFFDELEKNIQGKKIGLFGSFDWGDGQWMSDWEDRVKNAGAELYSTGLTINISDIDDLSSCEPFARGFEKF